MDNFVRIVQNKIANLGLTNRQDVTDFDKHAGDYSAIMNTAVGWASQDHDIFVAAKARLLQTLLRRHFGDPKQATVLDVGCGIGLIDRHLEGSVGRLSGIDISEESIVTAGQACPSCDFQAYDGRRIPFDDASFDLAFAVCVVHHVPPPAWRFFAREMARVLKPGGIAVIMEHNPYNPVTRHVVKHCEFDHDAVLLTMRSCRKLLEQADLEIVKRDYMTFIPFHTPVNAAIEELLGWLPLGAQYVVAAMKSAEK